MSMLYPLEEQTYVYYVNYVCVIISEFIYFYYLIGNR